MPRPRNQPSAFGRRAAFPTTWWTGIADASHQEALRAELYRQYWDPLYCYALRDGHAREDAQDFTQGFLTEILCGRDFLSKADRTRGRFRSLLIKSFRNYIGNSLRKRKVPLGREADVSEYEIPDTVPRDPQAAFDYASACNVLEKVLADLESECRRDGLETHWGLFQERVVKPRLGGQPALGLAELCRRYALSPDDQASNMIVTVKRRFARLLLQYLTCPGASQEEKKEALDDFLSTFAQGRPA